MTDKPDDESMEGVVPTPADAVAHPEQPPMDDDASGLPDSDIGKPHDGA